MKNCLSLPAALLFFVMPFLVFSQPGSSTWLGGTSTDWNDADNWDNGVPGINTDVQILSGSTYYPVLAGHLGVDTTSAEIPYTCAYIIISNGGSLTIDADDADLIVKGQIEVEGIINVADDIHLCNGAQLDIYNNAVIKCGLRDGEYGKTHLYAGSTVNQHDGELYTEEIQLDYDCQYNGYDGTAYIYSENSIPPLQYITINDPDSFFDLFWILDSHAALHNCSYAFNADYIVIENATFQIEGDTINCKGTSLFGYPTDSLIMDGGEFNIETGVYLNGESSFVMTEGTVNCNGYWGGLHNSVSTVSGGEMYVRENFIHHNGGFHATGGTVILYGDVNTDIDGSGFFYNLIIDKDPGKKVYMQLDILNVSNDLTINGGYLDPENQLINVGGNWTNNVGDAGFLEGTSTVAFNGNTRADITTDETFYKLTMNKTVAGFDALEFMHGLTINVLDDFRILDGGVEMNMNSTLIVGDTLFFEAGAGLNAYGDTGLTIEVGGDWINNNTFYNTAGVGFAPGTSTVSFTGNQNASIQYAGDVESFFDVVLDKPGDTLFYNDSIAFHGSFHIQNGVFRGNYTPTRLFDDLTVESSGKWQSGSLIFTGEADQSVTLGGFSLFGKIVVDKQAADFMPLSEGSTREVRGAHFTGNAGREGNRSQSVQFHSDIWIFGGEDLIIDEGILQCDNILLYVDGNINVNSGGTLIMAPGGTINLAEKLLVNSGGQLEVIGTETDTIYITGSSGYFMDGLIVRDGGTIRSEYNAFGRMTDSAVYIQDGAIVDPAYAFNHCSFAGFDSGTTLLTINNNQELSITGIDFGTNPGRGSYNVAKEMDQGLLHLSGVSGAFAGPAYEDDTYDRIDWADQGTWLGIVSTDWFSSPNWQFGMIPDGSTDVVIPDGCTYYPVITVRNTVCRDLEIQTGGQITISERFYVYRDAVIHGHVILDIPTTSQWYNYGDISWEAGSQCTDATTSYIIARGDWTFQAGSNVTLDAGIVWMHSFYSQKIISHESNSHFNYVRVMTVDTLDFCSTSTDSLLILEAMVIESGSLVTVHSTHPIIFHGNIISFGGHFQANAGEIVFQGIGGAIDLAQGDYLNNVTFNTSLFLFIQNNTYSDTLVINGNLVIGTESSGGAGFNPQNNVTVVYGDWINHIGTSGFVPGTSTVIIKGTAISDIYGQTTFYNLYAHKTSQFIRIWDQVNVTNVWKIVNGLSIVFGTVISEFLDFDHYNASLIVDGGVVETEYFDQGGSLQVYNGDFIAYSIEEEMGLEGIYHLDGGSISIVQDQARYLDISGNITIVSGYFTLAGGHDDSYWPAEEKTCTLTIAGGVFDIGTKGICLRTGLTADISSGRIRTERNLLCEPAMTTFRPSGGVFEFAGNGSSTAFLSSGNWLHDVWVNKTGGLSVNAFSDLLIKNELNIINGQFSTNGYLIRVGD